MLDDETEEYRLIDVFHLAHLLYAAVLSSLLDVVLIALRRPQPQDDVAACFAQQPYGQ